MFAFLVAAGVGRWSSGPFRGSLEEAQVHWPACGRDVPVAWPAGGLANRLSATLLLKGNESVGCGRQLAGTVATVT